MQRPIFILGFHKSGTTLLRSLLDNIQGLFVIPIETHIFEHLGFWVDYEIRRQLPIDLTFRQLTIRILHEINISNLKGMKTNNRGGDSIEGGKWAIEQFTDHFTTFAQMPFEQKDYRTLVNVYFDSLHLALTGCLPDENIRFVEKSVENSEFASYLHKLFPDAVFLHIIRNPYAALVASRKFRTSRKRYPYLGTITRAMENSFYHAFLNPQVIPNYHLIRYEDLVLDTPGTMQKVADVTGIPYSSAMLTPSTLGKLWKGNSMSGREFQGVSTAPIDSWKQEIQPLESSVINLLLPHVLQQFSYESFPISSSELLPCSGETIPMYFANRFFWITSKNRRNRSVDYLTTR